MILGEILRDAEISNFYNVAATSSQHDVLRLQVTVKDLLEMNVMNS